MHTPLRFPCKSARNPTHRDMIGLPARAQRRTFSCTHARKHGCAIANSSRAHTNPRRRLIWTINRWAFARHRSIDRDVLGIIDHPSSWRLLSKRKKEKKKQRAPLLPER
ncbi:hypothetical protein [Oryza sativa Japonica Group]|uniref:Uncharacterized protein P0410E03.9 n=1 Tax=Oryza sativa subsp. japonica TaxID=39947 RepID=Q9AX84_ORYSJ|nr:hypothetical protein [Oryza sativa Japonica Group]